MLYTTLLIVKSLVSPIGWARPTHYRLNPKNVEEVLAGLGSRPRLVDTKWLEMLGSRRTEVYTAVTGDTLWSIARKVLGNPFLWRKLWQENPFLTNPHEIPAGTPISYYREARDVASVESVIKVPLFHLLPPGKNQAIDLERATVVSVDIKNKFRPSFFVLASDDEVFGEITGAYTERDSLGLHEAAYIRPGPKGLKGGERYSIVHVEKEINGLSDGSHGSGKLTRYIGELSIVEMGERLAKATIDNMAYLVKRGDKLIKLVDPVVISGGKNPPNQIQTRIIAGEQAEAKWFGQGEVVLLNKGKNEGIEIGYVFRVFREKDPNVQSIDTVEPEAKGEVQIIHTGDVASIGYILRSLEPLEIGDTLIPQQAFSDPETPPHIQNDTVEIE